MIFLAVELGLRAVDIQELKLSNFDFVKKEISVTQHKTGSLNVCPMSPDLGWALIDYIQNGRLKHDSPFVFLTCNAPYRQVSAPAITTVLKTQMKRIGMSVESEYIATGIHSLRHSLAHRLLDDNVSVEMIANVMEQEDIISASAYLKGDINGLRKCALSLGGVL
jgi:integrase